METKGIIWELKLGEESWMIDDGVLFDGQPEDVREALLRTKDEFNQQSTFDNHLVLWMPTGKLVVTI